MSRSWVSRPAIPSPSLRRCSRTVVGSSPFSFIRRASAFAASLRSALSWSSWPARARRRMSSASSSSSSLVTAASPRRASALRTWSGEARSSLRSITALLEGISRVETPVAAVLVDEDLEIDAAGDQIDGEHVELGVQGLAQPEGAAQEARAHQRHDVDVHRDRLVQHVTTGGRDSERFERLRGDLNAGALGQAERARRQQHGPVRRVDVEREVEVGRLVGADELPPAQLVGGRRPERRAVEGEQGDRVHDGGRGEFGTGVLEFGAGIALVSVLNADALLVMLVQPSTNVGALLYDLRRHRSAIAGLL